MGWAVVTGASSGLGSEFSRLFAASGHSLVLVARRRELLQKAASDLLAAYSSIKVEIVDMDLGQPGAGTKLFNEVTERGLTIDFLVNNAGFGSNGEFQNLPLEKELQMIDLNVRTLLELSHLFLPGMVERKFGRILNVSSTAGFQPGPYMATYYATKAFVNSFSESLHQELAGTGVSCTALAPGATATEFGQVSGVDKSLLFKLGGVDSAKDVALVGYKAMFGGKALAVAGCKNSLLVQSLRVSPRFLVRKLVAKLNRVEVR